MDKNKQSRISEQRGRRSVIIGGAEEEKGPIDRSKHVGTRKWCEEMGPFEHLILKMAKLPEGAFGNPLKSPDQIEPITEPGLHGER